MPSLPRVWALALRFPLAVIFELTGDDVHVKVHGMQKRLLISGEPFWVGVNDLSERNSGLKGGVEGKMIVTSSNSQLDAINQWQKQAAARLSRRIPS